MPRRRMPKVIQSPADLHEGKQAEQRREMSVGASAPEKPEPKAPAEKPTQKATPAKAAKADPAPAPTAAEPKPTPEPKKAPQKPVTEPTKEEVKEKGVQRSVRVPIDDASSAKISRLSTKMDKPVSYIEDGLLKKALAAAKVRLKADDLAAIADELRLLHSAHSEAKYRTTEKKLVLTDQSEKELRAVVDDPLEVISINSLAGALVGVELKRIVAKL